MSWQVQNAIQNGTELCLRMHVWGVVCMVLWMDNLWWAKKGCTNHLIVSDNVHRCTKKIIGFWDDNESQMLLHRFFLSRFILSRSSFGKIHLDCECAFYAWKFIGQVIYRCMCVCVCTQRALFLLLLLPLLAMRLSEVRKRQKDKERKGGK